MAKKTNNTNTTATKERTMNENEKTARDEAVSKIARDEFLLTTLECQSDGDKDFQEVAVWEIKKALEAAYEAGRNSK